MLTAPTALAERQGVFVSSYLPVIAARCAYRFRKLPADAAAEAEQDVVTACWQSYTRAAEAAVAWDGKAVDRQHTATPNSVATFAIAAYTTGREALGSDTTDALSPGTRRAGKATVMHLDGDHLGVEKIDVPAQLISGTGTDPAATVRRQMDWEAIGRRCTPNARRTLVMLARGWRPGEIATRLKVTPGRVTQLKQQIAEVARSLGYSPPSRPFRHNDDGDTAVEVAP
jgi:hypothetical protein